MADVIDRVEEAATEAMQDFAVHPYLGGRAPAAIPADAVALSAQQTGYITHIDVAALGTIADRYDLTIYVDVLPGTMMHPARRLLHVKGEANDAVRSALFKTFTIERHRSFDQDPRLGLIALSEIASRALAPATNDPGKGISRSSTPCRACS